MKKKQFLIVVIISGLLLLLEFISFLIIPSLSPRTEIVLVQGIIRSLLIPITASLFGVFTFLFMRYRVVNKSLRAFLLVLIIISALGGYLYIMTKSIGNVIAYTSVYYNDLSGNGNESINQSETESDVAETANLPDKYGEILFQKIFAEKGFQYNAMYNAKGNYYVVLGEATVSLNGESVNERHTFVYDRESKNGTCMLFVEYIQYLDLITKSEISSEMLNTYAVKMDGTDEVIPSGKTSWSMAGNEAYQTATGEP